MVRSTPAKPASNTVRSPLGRPNSPFMAMTPPTAITQAAIEPTSGQGLGLTRW
jgi:hypothetical protein